MHAAAVMSDVVRRFGKKYSFITPGHAYGHSLSAGNCPGRAGSAFRSPRPPVEPETVDPRKAGTGLAPLIVKEVPRIVAQMRADGISVLLVEQNVRMSLEISDHAYVLENGQMVYSGPAAELRADETRIQALARALAEE
jgi:ABC-type histidine transport system ATPase subunit